MEDAKVEQQKIMGEITSIRKGLDQIMSHREKI
jgi:hypothetical protein